MSTGIANPAYGYSPSAKVTALFLGDIALMDEGSLFVATNATPGTAVATTTSVVDDATGATTHAQQKPVMAIRNDNVAGGGYYIYPRSLKMVIAQVPTSATSWRYAIRISPNGSSKITTAGTVIVPVNPNGSSSAGSKAYINFGAITATDSATDVGQRLVANGLVTGAIPVANDEWIFTFGDGPRTIDLVGTQTLVKRLTVPVPAIAIPPGWVMTLEMWGTSNAAAPSWEFEFVYAERAAGL